MSTSPSSDPLGTLAPDYEARWDENETRAGRVVSNSPSLIERFSMAVSEQPGVTLIPV